MTDFARLFWLCLVLLYIIGPLCTLFFSRWREAERQLKVLREEESEELTRVREELETYKDAAAKLAQAHFDHSVKSGGLCPLGSDDERFDRALADYLNFLRKTFSFKLVPGEWKKVGERSGQEARICSSPRNTAAVPEDKANDS